MVVTEVQTPSDVTYRLYDWGRLGLDGQPRELHVEQALANIRYDVAEEEIVQPRRQSSDAGRTIERLMTCERFLIDRLRFDAKAPPELPRGAMAVWIVLSGSGALVCNRNRCDFSPGDVVLMPADSAGISVHGAAACELLEVRTPASDAVTGSVA